MPRKTPPEKLTKVQLREQLDRALAMADRQYGVYSVDPNASPDKDKPPRNVGSVEPGEPAANERVPVIPTASFDPIRSEGNWAPFRPSPEPIPGMVPGFRPGQPMMGTAQWGGTGTPITAGFLTDLGEYNPEVYGRSAVQTYEKMRRGDAQVWATLTALKSPLRSARWDIRPGIGPNEPGYQKAVEVSKFVKDNIFGGLEFQTSTGGMASQSWDAVLWNALLMLDFGCSVHENVFRVDGNFLKLRCMTPLLPITFYRWHTENDGYTLISLEQYGYRGIEFLNATIPAEKICRFTLHQEGSNFWGLSLTRSMYPHWYVKTNLYRIDALASERNGLGVPVIILPQGASAQDFNSAYNFVTKLSAHELTGLVLPNGATFKIEGVTGTPRDIQKAIEHHNRMISTAAMAMFMTIGSAPHGSRATAATQHDFFLSSTHFLSNQVSERLSETTVKKLVLYNFGPDAVVPKIRAMNLKMRDFEDVRAALQELSTAGLLVSDLPLRNYIRNEYELAEETEEGVLITKKGESIEDEPGGQDIATPTNVPDPTGKAGKGTIATPTNVPDTRRGKTPIQAQPRMQVGKPTPGNQTNEKEYGKIVKPVEGPKQPKSGIGDVIQSSDTPFARTDGVVQAPDEELSEVEAFQPTIYFVRHGETADDVTPGDGIISSWSNVGLTKKGMKEAQETAALLKDKDIGEIYAGDLERTMQTAEAISKATGVPVTPEHGLRGWNVGAYTGMRSSTELRNGRTIAQQLAWLQEHPSMKPPGGDSWLSTDARINDAIAACIRRAETIGKPIVVVTHSRVINSLPSLSRGAIPQAISEEKGVMLGRVAKAVKDSDDNNWSITYNTRKLSDVGYHSVADDMPIPVPGNQSGEPTHRAQSKRPNNGPPMDEKQEAQPNDAGSPSVGGTAPQRSGKSKPVGAVGPQQAEQGAKIVHAPSVEASEHRLIADDGSWITVNGAKVHINDAGVPDGGARIGGSANLQAASPDRSKWPDHIQQLNLPPAWTGVRYSADPDADLQAIGKDSKGRDQYVYSQKFQDSQAALKFERIGAMDKEMPLIDKQLAEGRQSANPIEREHADAASLVRNTGIRPGSEEDTMAKVKAYGATTLEGRHVETDKEGNTRLRFVGKKGVNLDIPVEDKETASMLRARKEQAGENGQLFPHVSQSSLLDYTHKTLDHGGFKTKDFRTHLGTETAQKEIASMKPPKTRKEYAKQVKEVATRVSKKLGNTPSVALKSYIAPQVFSEWKAGYAAP